MIGAGSWAIANHIPILAARDDVDLVSAVRTNREALAMLRDRFGFEHVSDDYRDALALGLDAVVVASPAGLHYEHVKAALEAGAHVLCEKPFTTEPEHAWELHDIASELGRHLLLALGWNYRPTAIEAKRLMEAPGVGNVSSTSWWPWPPACADSSTARGVTGARTLSSSPPSRPGPIPGCPEVGTPRRR